MNIDPKSGSRSSELLLTGIGLGLAANYLIWPAGLKGPGFALWIVLLVAAALWLTKDGRRERSLVIACWGTTAILATLVLVLRDLDELIPAMCLVIFSSATMVFLHVKGVTLVAARVPDLLIAMFRVPASAVTGTPLILLKLDAPADTSKKQWFGILRGILIALPLLIVFGALFSSADAAFTRLIPDLSQLFSATTIPRLVLTCFFAWVSAGLLEGISRQYAPRAVHPPWTFKLGKDEIAVVMGLLTALFLVFVVLQITYLFGGRATIEATTGLTLAEYARRGFFELVAVAGLTLVVLVVLGAASGSQRLFRILAAILIACVMIILASALQRFVLYIDAYGMTVQRLIALAAMLWLAVCLVLFASTVLRDRIAGFAAGLAVSGIAITLLFGFMNPAALVAKVNIERIISATPASTNGDTSSLMGTQTIFDLGYLLTLRADAVPVLLAHLDQLAPLEQCQLASELLGKRKPENSSQEFANDWRTWNASQARAAQLVEKNTARLQQIVGNFQIEGLGICVRRQ